MGNEKKPDENGELVDSVRGRSIGVSQDGVYVCVGFKDGTVRVYDKELKQK
jgi:microtubule-associated protein-like 6